MIDQREYGLFSEWLAWYATSHTTAITLDQMTQAMRSVQEFLVDFAECELGVEMTTEELLQAMLQWDAQRVMQ